MTDFQIPKDFKVQKGGMIHQSNNSHVYLGDFNSQPSILKIFPSKYPSEEIIRFYQKDYQINMLLYEKYPNHFSKPIKFKNEENELYSIKSSLGISLQQHQKETKTFNTPEFLKLGIQICQALHFIHEQNVIHCDIKPQNIMYDKKKDSCSIIDFESSFIVSLKNPAVSKTTRGTFSFMSPEQTGRTTKSIDKTSDIYSLGITFYYMLTGELPFQGEYKDVIYAHIAIQPPLISSIRHDIPIALESVIQKMMKKNQKDRYYSVMGIKNELEFILNNLENKEKIQNFKAGQYNLNDIFSFQNKIYGREKEKQIFKEKIQKIQMNKTTELVMISGASGIGKSSLVAELLGENHENLVISGKFDQFMQSPFDAVVQILKKYFQTLSSESKENLKIHKMRMLNALKGRGKIITGLVPESKFILGEQTNLQQFPNEIQEQKRFIETLVDFFNYISDNQLVCLFFDDLQWSDIPSLQFIEALIKQQKSNILIIGAYRDNEVSSVHPMVAILEPIVKEKNFETIKLNNLDTISIEQMLKDALSSDNVKTLSDLVFKKTNGNPFFIREFVFNLYDKKFIKFDYSNEKWTWDLEKISTTKFSDNVVEFMIQKMHDFPSTTKKILNIASCIGCEFTLDIIAIIQKKSEEEIYSILVDLMKKGWIFEIDNHFKFVHDRLQQASYEIFQDKKQLHLEMGELLYKKATQENELEKHIFDISNHLNSSGEYFKDKLKLIELNLLASDAALSSHAFTHALEFTKKAQSLLPKNSWETDHHLTFNVLSKLSSNFYSNRMMDDALIIREELFENSKTNIEKLKVVSPLIKLHLIKLNYKKATEYIFAIFDLYDFTKETTTLKDPNEIRKFSVKLYNEIKEFIKKIETTKEFLDAIPNHSNEEMTLFCEFNISANSAFHHMWNFEMLIASRLIGALAIIKFGYNDYAAGLLSSGSWFGHCVFKKSDLKKIGLFAYDLFNRIENPTLKLFAMMTLAYNFQFCGSAEQGMEIGHKGYTLALSVGEYTYGPQCIWAEFEFKLVTGCNFARLYNQIESAKKIIYGAGNIFIGDLIELASERCAVLTGRKNEFSPKIKIPNFETRELTRSILSCAKIFGLYLLRDYDSAKKLVDEFSSISVESIGLPMHYEVYFYSILVCYSLSSPIDYVEDIKKNLDILKEHYDINPQYFSAQYFLADAIYQSLVNSNTQQVFNSFLKALKYSKHIDFHSALTYEYFSKFCNQNAEFAEFADFFESKAFVKYKRMEAFCKYKHLRNIDFMKTEGSTSDSTSLNQISSSPFSGITSYASGNSIDLQTILKSSETIAEGLNKEKLLKKLNQVIVQNAGAEKGYIILKENNKFIIKSEFSKKKENENLEIKEQTNLLSIKIFNTCLNQKDTIILKNGKEELPNDEYVQENNIKSVICAPIKRGGNILGILYLENNSMEGTFTQSRKFIFTHILSQVAIAIENITLFEDVKTINTAYARFLPSEFLNQLSKKDVRNIQPSDSVEKKMTILFSDIRNFTSITEKMNAKESFEFVNEILSKLAPSISSNNGFVDKFIGDCVMAIFPISPLDGVKAGIQMLKSLEELNKTKDTHINIGVGLAFGNVMLGTLGFEQRLDATVISNIVNTASRMESLTKTFGVNIIITEEVFEEIKNDSEFICNLLGRFYLKGQENAKKLFEVALKLDKYTSKDAEFQLGVKFFSQKKFIEALKIFEGLKNEKKVCEYYINVCELYEHSSLPEGWNGEIKLSKDGDPELFTSEEIFKKKEKILIQQLMRNPEKFAFILEEAKKFDQKE